MPRCFFYIGEYPDGKSDILAYDSFLFSPGVSVELPEPFASKARGNRFFVEVDVSEPPPAVNPLEFSKPELIDMADKAGVRIDRRWSAERIAKAIMDAANQLPEGQ